MSTLINTETPIPTKPLDGSSITFTELIERLNSQTSPPSLEQLNAWLSSVEIFDHDLQPYIGFKEGNYWRHRVCRNDAVEMLVICWRPGQKTPIHDHNGSHGAVFVQQGMGWRLLIHIDEVNGDQVVYRQLNAARQPLAVPKSIAIGILVSNFIPEAAAY